MGVFLYFLMSFFVVMGGFIILGVTFYHWKKYGIPKDEAPTKEFNSQG